MVIFKRILDLFLYSNLFISVCAAAITAETYLLIHADINWLYVSFVFFSTLVFYDFPSLYFAGAAFSAKQSGRHKWIVGNRKLLMAFTSAAIIVLGVLVFFFPFKFILCMIPTSLLAFAYFFPQTRLRNISGLKAGIVALVWTSVTVISPLLLMSEIDLHRTFAETNAVVILQNFLFIFPLCLIFNVRDIEADRRVGVKTFPVLHGTKATIAACLISLILFSILVIFSPSLQETRVGLLISAAASAVLVLFASEKRSDYYYSLWVDGMILLQALMVAATRYI